LEKKPYQYETIEKGHGRLEIRRIWTSTALNDYVNFPHVQQVFLIERLTTSIKTGKERHELVCGVTSLTPQQASPEEVLNYNRGHWGIENREHYVRDVTFDEDRSKVRTQQGPRMMAALRNLVISVCRLLKLGDNIAQATRAFARKPHLAMQAIGI